MWVIFLALHSNLFKFTAFPAVQTCPVQYAEDMSSTAQDLFSPPLKKSNRVVNCPLHLFTISKTFAQFSPISLSFILQNI